MDGNSNRPPDDVPKFITIFKTNSAITALLIVASIKQHLKMMETSNDGKTNKNKFKVSKNLFKRIPIPDPPSL